MSNNYKLCPNCSNALDLNVSKCPYCWQQIFWLDLSRWDGWFVKTVKDIERSADNKKQTSGCAKVIIIFIVIQIIGAVLSLIFQILAWL
jgi:hypothetical protein